jgi:hypothetical protein
VRDVGPILGIEHAPAAWPLLPLATRAEARSQTSWELRALALARQSHLSLEFEWNGGDREVT